MVIMFHSQYHLCLHQTCEGRVVELGNLCNQFLHSLDREEAGGWLGMDHDQLDRMHLNVGEEVIPQIGSISQIEPISGY